MAKRGRPSVYKPDYATQAEKLCALGATDQELAEFFSVDVRTVQRWRLQHEDFCRAVKSGKEASDERVERSLYQRAIGYDVTEQQAIKVRVGTNQEEVRVVEVTRHVPPDTTAAIFWLKNRRPQAWRDKQEIDHAGNLVVEIRRFGADDADRPAE